MAALVTLAVAKAHLQIPPETTDADADIQRKADQASASILAMMTTDLIDPTWTADTVPTEVQALVLSLLGYLYGNRGDADSSALRVPLDPRPDLMRELMRLGYRDPVLA